MRLTTGKAASIGLTVALCLTLLGGTATADPNLDDSGVPLDIVAGGFLPDTNDIVGVGADTTQYVMNAAAADYSLFENTDVRLASFDAIQPGTETSPVTGDIIVAEDPNQFVDADGFPVVDGDETTIVRPNGTRSGVRALGSNGSVDYVRSVLPPGTVAGRNLSFIPVLTDGMSYIVDKAAGTDLRDLSALELGDIYRCVDPRGYHPRLPHSASGARTVFLNAIGVAEWELGPCVDQVQQPNDPAAVAGDPLALMPFSFARYVNNPADPANPPSGVVDLAATASGTGVFFFQHTIFNIVRRSHYNAADSPLPAIFGPDGYLCHRFANSVIDRQGFGVAHDCGRPWW